MIKAVVGKIRMNRSVTKKQSWCSSSVCHAPFLFFHVVIQHEDLHQMLATFSWILQHLEL
jgi:hypothetical protein